MTDNKIIHVRASGWDYTFREAKAGYVSYLLVNGLRYPPELRQSPPPDTSPRGQHHRPVHAL